MRRADETGKFIISHSPHVHSGETITKIMWQVVLALLPAGLVGFRAFGPRTVNVIFICCASAILTEWLIRHMRRAQFTIYDGSALLTGLLLAYNLPSNIPIWMAGLGSVFAIAVAKEAFGGIGYNIFNPALCGRVFLQISFPLHLSSWPDPRLIGVGATWEAHASMDALTAATPLAHIKYRVALSGYTYWDLFLGRRGGCIGEISVLALLIGVLYLLYKKCISLHTPISFIGTVALMSWAFGGRGLFNGDWLIHLLTGGLVLGAFFMATDMVTSPLTHKGQLLFGFGCGLITSVIRLWGGYPEGVSYSILIMNAAVPFIDRYTLPRKFGAVAKAK